MIDTNHLAIIIASLIGILIIGLVLLIASLQDVHSHNYYKYLKWFDEYSIKEDDGWESGILERYYVISHNDYMSLTWRMFWDIEMCLVTIGCKTKSIKDWDEFFSDKCTSIYSTNRNTRKWKKIKRKYEFLRTYLIDNNLIRV